MIYFDNAATTLTKPESVYRAIMEALQLAGNATRGTSDYALNASRIIYETRVKLAELFGIKDESRVAFTYNGTESLNLAIQGVFQKGDHVITTVLEHNSILRPLYLLQKQGIIEISFISCNALGVLNYEEVEQKIKSNTAAIICTHASNLTGNVVDIGRIGQLCKAYNLLFILDVAQSAGILPIDVEEACIDILCFTGHKSLYGPQGTGGIYVREGVKIRPLKVGGSGINTYDKEHPGRMPDCLEAGTLNTHGISGLKAGITFILNQGIEQIRLKEQALMRQFYEGIKGIKGVTIYGDFFNFNRVPIVTLNINDIDAARVSDILMEEYGIATRTGGHCAPLLHQTLGTMEQSTVRFSFSYFNTQEEVNIGIQAIRALAEEIVE
ncbi:MAG: aminotransferase class V-fold PLP-dependent enzyme [Niameybacter sp.]|uniref:aminotransferase class V-fold PLP-dependent enzyme n=1 Tax=Niameybacter sp. TaxID=2033640 RepID=UPI002FC68F6A